VRGRLALVAPASWGCRKLISAGFERRRRPANPLVDLAMLDGVLRDRIGLDIEIAHLEWPQSEAERAVVWDFWECRRRAESEPTEVASGRTGSRSLSVSLAFQRAMAFGVTEA
jgi:hypothetical protein